MIGPTQDGSSSHEVDIGRPDLSPVILDLGSLTLQGVTPTPTPFPQMDPKACQVTLELVLQWVDWGGSSGRASCLRTRGVGTLGAGLATIQVIRSGMFLPPPKKKKKKRRRNKSRS